MFKNLKSLFVITEPEEITTNSGKIPEGQIQPKAANAPANNIPNANNPPKANDIDNKILDKLLLAIEENNQQGFDYLEYRRSLKALASLPMDEATKFQSAFATASTMGVTLQKLLESIDFYKKVLQNEDDKFTKATKSQSSINVESKIKERDNLHLAIQEKSKQIQKLTAEIRQHQGEMEAITKYVETSEFKIKETARNFESALLFLQTQLNQDAEKLKQFIK